MAEDATKAAMPDRPQQTSPFLKLPIELRIMIYDLALQDVLDDIAKARKDEKPVSVDEPLQTLPFVGALAIPHTSHELRGESIDGMRSLTELKFGKSLEALRILWKKQLAGDYRDLKESIRLGVARRDVRTLRDTLQKLAQNQNLFRLSRLRVNLPWPQMAHEQKCREVRKWYYSLNFDDKHALYRSIRGSEDVEGALVKIVDSSVGPHEKEQ